MCEFVSGSSHRLASRTACLSGLCWGLLLSPCLAQISPGDTAPENLFESAVRPVLIERCLECHGPNKQEGGLRLDSLPTLLTGGESGPAIVPGAPRKSLLIQAVQRSGDLEMPPDEALSAVEIDAISAWISQGALWPESNAIRPDEIANAARSHWAFAPVQEPQVPHVENADRHRSPVDAFVEEKLRAAGLDFSPEADRRTLIRRASYTLTGLPPTAQEVEDFVNDPDRSAYERLIDRLLDSPRYGEHWARHWLDVARYSDTKGYVYAREERFWVHAWAYRDWVVRAFTEDLPYDRFLLLQLAADQIADRRDDDLVAMGFLTLGRRFLGVPHEIIDDRIDVVSRGTMGLTVGCARCHNHKYDPIPTADYYSLYGIFASSAERLVPLPSEAPRDESFETALRTRQEKLKTTLADNRIESADRVRNRIGDYLHAQTELHKYPAQGFDQVFEKSDLLPAFVRQIERYLRLADQRRDPVFVPWHLYRKLDAEAFVEDAVVATRSLQDLPEGAVNARVLQAFSTPPKSFRDVIDRYAVLFETANAEWQSKSNSDEPPAASTPAPSVNGSRPVLPDPDTEQLWSVLYGPQAPCEVPDQPIVHTETFFDSATCTNLWKLQGEVDRWIINSPNDAPHALILVDRPVPVEPRIFRRGNPLNPGDEVPRQFLSVLTGERRTPFRQGSGRLELARAIIDSGNPLTPRVIVNRVWAHHFGRGLVQTPSDFGLRSDPPSHPQLLDWLASQFVENGWSLKSLHRRILLSTTFRQSSLGPVNDAVRDRALKRDPDNRLLWKMNARRLSFEEFRDSVLAAAGELDRKIGGKPVDLFQEPYTKRRTLYGLVDRQFFPGTLRMFDFANPDLHIPKRSETTVPQQALFFMNHPLALDRVRALTDIAGRAAAPGDFVREMFRRILQRDPTRSEVEESLELIRAASAVEAPPVRATAGDWQYGYGAFNETENRVDGFTPLPHFTGQAWQGGPKWPDSKLGWVQLTALGGHPGNDVQHAAVRRWIAPRTGTIAIRSTLAHEPPAGDGIRAFVVSSRGGLLQSTTIHQQTVELNLERLDVERGETIDFVVDIGKILNSDQYLWSVNVTDSANPATVWESQADFPSDAIDELTPREQLAQVLLCTNEFLFID